jgi:hypothetical protein
MWGLCRWDRRERCRSIEGAGKKAGSDNERKL